MILLLVLYRYAFLFLIKKKIDFMITYKYPFYPRKSDNKFFIGIMWEGESFIQRREKKKP